MKSLKKGGPLGLIDLYHDPDLRFPNLVDLIYNVITIFGSRANPNVSDEVIQLLDKKIIRGDALITHTFPLEQDPDALDTFINRKGNSLKVVIEPCLIVMEYTFLTVTCAVPMTVITLNTKRNIWMSIKTLFIIKAFEQFRKEVEENIFPETSNSYEIEDKEFEMFVEGINKI